MTGTEYPRYRITKRRFRPEHAGSIDFLRVLRPRAFFRMRRDGAVDEDTLQGNDFIPWLYDRQLDAMLFLRIPEEVDPTRAVFLYHTMRLEATHVVVVPMADFYRMAGSHVGHGHDIVWLYNVGRCGSTLLSHAISDATPSTGLSETAYHLQVLRLRRHMTDDERIRYMAAMTHWYADRYGPKGGDGALVIKIPHPCMVIHDLIDASVPEARSMFMYRDATKVVRSQERVAGSIHGKSRWAFHLPVFHWFAAFIATILSIPFRSWFAVVDTALRGTRSATLVRRHGFLAALTLMWIVYVHMFMAMRDRRDVPAVRYEDITPETFPAILERMRLGPVDRVALRNVMGRDSQAGTALSRKRKGIALTDDDVITVRAIVQDHTSIGAPDVVLPGTMRP